MKLLGWLKAVLSVVFGLALGLAVTGIVNLLHPAESIGWTLAAVLTSSVLSALVGFLVTNQRKKPPAPAQPKEAGADSKTAGAEAKKG